MYTTDTLTKEFIFLEHVEAPLLPEFDLLLENYNSWNLNLSNRHSLIDSLIVPDEEFGEDLQVSPLFWLNYLLNSQNIPVTFEINCDLRDDRVVNQDVMAAVKLGAKNVVLFTNIENNFERLYDITSNLKDLQGVDLPIVPVGIHSPALLKAGPYNPMDFLIAGVDFVIIPEHYDPNIILPAIQEFDHLGIVTLIQMGIFHDPSMILWAEKHLDLGVTREMYERIAGSPSSLEESLRFALDFIHLIYDFGARGAILKLPMTPKRQTITSILFPLLEEFLESRAFSTPSIE